MRTQPSVTLVGPRPNAGHRIRLSEIAIPKRKFCCGDATRFASWAFSLPRGSLEWPRCPTFRQRVNTSDLSYPHWVLDACTRFPQRGCAGSSGPQQLDDFSHRVLGACIQRGCRDQTEPDKPTVSPPGAR